jgi:hypothetical protein
MTALANAAVKFVATALAVVLSRTATVTGTGIDLLDYEGMAIVTQSAGAATAGTLPTWDGKIQDSADNSTGWADVTGATFTQVTTTAAVEAITIDVNKVKRYIRYVGTVGGTSTPTFPVGSTFLGVKKSS